MDKLTKGEVDASAPMRAEACAVRFENLPLHQPLGFYHQEQGWPNRLIAGESFLHKE